MPRLRCNRSVSQRRPPYPCILRLRATLPFCCNPTRTMALMAAPVATTRSSAPAGFFRHPAASSTPPAPAPAKPCSRHQPLANSTASRTAPTECRGTIDKPESHPALRQITYMQLPPLFLDPLCEARNSYPIMGLLYMFTKLTAILAMILFIVVFQWLTSSTCFAFPT